MNEQVRRAIVELENLRRADASMWWVPLEDKFSAPLSVLRLAYKPKHSPLPLDFARLEGDVEVVLQAEFGADKKEAGKFHKLYELSVLF